MNKNIFLSVLLLAAVAFSVIKIAMALQANPGHDISTLGGAAIGGILYGSAADVVSALADVAVGRVLISGGAGVAPLYSTTPTLGAVGALGTLSLAGNTSGVITIQPQAAAGTYNFNLPIGAGTAGQPLLSGAGGATAMTFGTLAIGAGGTGLAATADDAVFVGDSASAVTARVLPTCSGATTDKLLYNISTNTFSCGVDQTAGGGSFPTAKLAANITTTSATAYTTAFSYTPPVSAQVRLDFYLIESSTTAGNAVQHRVSSADTGNVGNCLFTIPTAAAANTVDLIAIASAPADDAGTLWLNTERTPVRIQCTFTSDATPGAVLLEFQGEIAATTYTVRAGSYYVAVTQP